MSQRQRSRKSIVNNRRLVAEVLEARQLLAGDIVDAIVDSGPLVRMDEAPLLGDIDGDGEVGFRDFLELADNFGRPGTAADGDINGDGFISFDDFKVFARNYGESDVPTEFELVAASSVGSDEIVLTFNDQPAEGDATPENFQITFCRTDVVCTPETTEILEVATATPIPNSTQISLKATGDVPAEANITVTPSKKLSSVSGLRNSGTATTFDNSLPRVTGAIAVDNNTIIVAFSHDMLEATVRPEHFEIVQENVLGEVGAISVVDAKFRTAGNLRVVELKTSSQNEVTYTVTAVAVTDTAGNALAPVQISSGIRVDPTSATFAGSPPVAGPDGTLVDTDGDGLSDNEETRGWEVVVKLANGETFTEEVSSDPNLADTDNDGLSDAEEKKRRTNPRDADTDDDLIDDARELNDLSTSPTNQDTDGDGLNDSSEFNFYRTSPTLKDTDGDQIPDNEEVLLSNRNPLVADLPQPSLTIGQTNLQLDVRFSASTSTQSRQLSDKTVTSTLEQSNSKEHSRTEGQSHQAFASASFGYSVETKAGISLGADSVGLSGEVTQTQSFGAEASYTGTYTASHTDSSSQTTQKAYQDSLSTQDETTDGETVNREVAGASMSVAVSLANVSDIAFTLKNLQITAFMQDPQDPTQLTPVATLVPEADLADGIALGPAGFGPTRGPFIFKSDTIFPGLVESLMKNPTGLIYRFSNFDIEDELQRNFAFTSQDIADRTASLVIDNGAYDADGDGVGDLSEINRVAVGSGRIVDTNDNGVIDENDERIVFDAEGDQVGISLREALQSLGLKRYVEPLAQGIDREVNKATEFPSLPAGLNEEELKNSIVASTDLTAEETRNSYSVTFTDDGLERIYRIRETVSRDPRLGETIGTEVAKTWEVLTATGINPSISTSDFTLSTDNGITLAYVQDLDQDRLPDMVEALNRSSDLFVDSDNRSLLFSLQSPNLNTLEAWRTDLGKLSIPQDLTNALNERNLNLESLTVTDLATEEAKSLRTELAARLPAWTLSVQPQDVGAPIALPTLASAAIDDVTAMVKDLDNRALTPLLRGEFAESNAALSLNAAISIVTPGTEWTVRDGTNEPFSIKLELGQLNVFKANESTAAFSLIPSDVNKLDAGIIPKSVVDAMTTAQQTPSSTASVQTVVAGKSWRIADGNIAFVIDWRDSSANNHVYTYTGLPFEAVPDSPFTAVDFIRATIEFDDVSLPAANVVPTRFQIEYVDTDGAEDVVISEATAQPIQPSTSFELGADGNIRVGTLSAGNGEDRLVIAVGPSNQELAFVNSKQYLTNIVSDWMKTPPAESSPELIIRTAGRQYLVQNEVGRLDVYDRTPDGIDNDGDNLTDELDEFLMDGLDDRFETMIGWQVNIAGRGSKSVFPSPTSYDTDGDGLSDAEEAPSSLVRDENGIILSPREFIRPVTLSDTWQQALDDGEARSRPQSNTGQAIYTGAADDTFTFTVDESGTLGTDVLAVSWQRQSATADAKTGVIQLNADYDGRFVSVADGIKVRFVTGTAAKPTELVKGESFTIKALQTQVSGRIGEAIKVVDEGGTAIVSSNSAAGAYTGKSNDTFTFVVVGKISGAVPGSTPLPAISCTRQSGVSCGASDNMLDYVIGTPVEFADGVTLSVGAGTLTLAETFKVDVTTEIITDPTSSDTDGDGVSDFDEIHGYCITLRDAAVGDPNDPNCSSTDANGKALHGQIFRKTDPTNPDSDGDTANDGLERRLGGDPTDPSDRDKFSDDDGDGLVNIVEKEGWLVTIRGVEAIGQPDSCDTVCGEVEASTSILITSDPNDADTDDDGVIDGNEHAFKTNPRSNDTDGDGLTDKEEILGLAIRDLGIIPPFAVDETNTRIAGLDPLDADTDNDRRSDGDEAKTPWIVRVAGANPEEVFSHPLISDEDLDKLVDGDEFRFGSHPQKSNTDGDRRDDFVEATTGLNPVQSDFRVTVVLASLEVLSDGDRDGGNDDTDEAVGEFQIQFGVKTPDEAAVTGVSEIPYFIHQFSTSVGTRGTDYTHIFGDDPGKPGDNAVCSTNCYHVNTLADGANEIADIIRFNSSMNFSFSMTSEQRFSIEGIVRELDLLPNGNNEGGGITPDANFGGFFDDPIKGDGGTEQLGVFEGSDLFDPDKSNVQFYTYDFEKGEGSTLMRGTLKFFFIVD